MSDVTRSQRFAAAWREWTAPIREQAAIDRTQLRPVVTHRGLVRVAAWVAIVGLFAWGWGESTVVAIAVLFGAEVHPPSYGPDTVWSQIRLLVDEGVIVAVAVLVIVCFRRFPAPPSPFPKVRPATWWKSFLVTPWAMVTGFALASMQTWFGGAAIAYPHASTGHLPSTLLYGLWGAMAGPMEELALLAMVVTVLRRAGYRWWTVYVVAVAVRVPFHLYYGWGALLLGVWAALVVALYKRTGTALPIAAAHALWDLGATPGLDAVALIKILCLFAGVIVLWKTVQRLDPATGDIQPVSIRGLKDDRSEVQ